MPFPRAAPDNFLADGQIRPHFLAPSPCIVSVIVACSLQVESTSMQRRRAKAIAIAQQQVLQTKLMIAAAMLLLPALLLLLISP